MAKLLKLGRLAGAVLLGVGACTTYGSAPTEPAGPDGTGNESGQLPIDGGEGGAPNTGSGGKIGSGGSGGSSVGGVLNLSTIRIEPADAVLEVRLGEVATQDFTVYGTEDGSGEELDVTDRSVFYVPDNYLIGGFPLDGTNPFSTRLPSAASEPVQRGGVLTVEAQARSADGEILTATTSLTVKLVGDLLPDSGSPQATPEIPEDPDVIFDAPLSSGSPFIVYPHDGVILPPNLGRLEVHFQSGSPEHTLFEVLFRSPLSELRGYTRCYADPVEFLDASCAFALGGEALEALAVTNGGTGPVQLIVRGTDEAGAVAESQAFDIEFTADRVMGALYYWTATNPTGIVRLDFGNIQTTPETFFVPADIPGNSKCVGCHVLPPAGDKVFIAMGNSSDSEIAYVADLTKPRTDADFVTYNGAELDSPLPRTERKNRVLFGSFAPDGSSFVAAGPRNDPEPDTRLFLHDVTTGVRNGFIDLPFIPSHVDWSADGERLAVTAVGGPNSTTLEFLGGGISVIEREDGVWRGSSPITVVPTEAGKNRYNASFLPDDSLLLYTEVDQASYTASQAAVCDAVAAHPEGRFCNGYSDPGATTWAVEPASGATPVHLSRAATPGPMDAFYPPVQPDVGLLAFMDTFPRAAPFAVQHRGKKLYFVTISSQRRAGLREFFPNASVVGDPASQVLIWMFAFDPEPVKDGEDGSYPAFFLPFQNLTTSNHMAEWTERIVAPGPIVEPPAPPPLPPRPEPP